MATLAEAILTLLNGDATLSSLLTGGVHNASDFKTAGPSADEIPRQANGVLVDPFAIVRFRDSDVTGPVKVEAEMGSVEIYLYDNVGYVTIDSALARIKTLLNFKDVTADDRSLAYFQFVHRSTELNAEEYGNIPSKFIRFVNLQIA